MTGGLSSIEHIVVLMLENRSLDHLLGFLYTDTGNVSLKGDPFDGLTGNESNPDADGKPVTVFRIEPNTPNAYFLPGADPGEGYLATNSQLFGSTTAPTPPVATNQGFVTNFAYTIGWETREKWSVVGGTTPSDIMGCFAPDTLPVLSGLAKGYAVCDQWFSSVPTETLPNRAFALSATSQGHLDDKTHTFTAPSIFGLLTRNNLTWAAFGYTALPLTKRTYTDILTAPTTNFGKFKDFQAAAKAGTLPAFTFLEPSWGSDGNSQHPNYDVALGEALIHDTYYALHDGPAWDKTLLVITYDEHGGCYDHVPPPAGATPPDDTAGEFAFDFTRFGVRVPTVLVSPLIEAGTVFRVPAGSTPLDHTSVLRTVENRWNLPALTARDAAAPDVSAVLTLTTPRTDDPLAGVTVPVSTGTNPSAGVPSHLQEVQAELVSRQFPAGAALPHLRTPEDYARFIRTADPDARG
ncbi:MAG TPA: alkaline phosphatase family protein [Pseudonocardiaceae bacterium]|jgi:phospholipase C|nr:alkaline phosphatase family protein [Pseudonocardiaceae bacterium]